MIRLRSVWRFLQDRLRRADGILLICTTMLSLMSLATLWGGRESFGTGTFVMQVAMTLAGFAGMMLISQLDYHAIINRFWIWFIIGSMGLLALTLLLGVSAGTNKSWLTIIRYGENSSISIQPSEFVKIAFICSFSKHLDLVRGKINHLPTLLGLGVHAGCIVGLILLSGDLGVSLVYLGIILVMLYCAGLSLWYYLAMIGVGVVAFPFLWGFLEYYQQQRILVGFNPELDPLVYGFQALEGKRAIVSGGWFGQGLFGGEVYQDLPASDTDFIFASFCEKFGIIGGILLIAVMLVIVGRLLLLVRRTQDNLGAYICAGVIGLFLVQVVENVGMCLATLPVIGITLPFMSAGGSSTLSMYLLMGVVHCVSTRSRMARETQSQLRHYRF